MASKTFSRPVQPSYFAKGETISNQWYWCYGYVISSGTRLALVVTLPKGLFGVSFTPTYVGIAVREPTGKYVLGSNYNATSYFTDAQMQSDYTLMIRLDKSDGWGVTGDSNNNIVIGQVVLSGSFS